jgi:kynureninase
VSSSEANRTGGDGAREEARALDAADPLAAWRDEFLIHDPDVAYLDGNSLGMTPLRTIERVEAVLREDWARGLIGSWEHWVDMPQRVGDTLAGLIGAGPGEVVVHDSVTIDLYQLVHAALALRPDRRFIAVATGEFPTDRYVVESVARATGRAVRYGLERLDDVAVAVRSLVDYRTAEVEDLAAETARAEVAGALLIWDLSHAAGLLDVDLHAAGAQLAVGCTYKYLNGGPGAPGFSYVASDLIGRIDQPIWGWFGQIDQFAMGPAYTPRPDVGRLLIGTPGIIGLTAAAAGIELTAEAGIAAISDKARALTSYGLDRCEALGLESPTPRDPSRRGGHFSVRHPAAATITRRLAADHRVITDFREPDLIRIGCSPLTTRFTDVYDGTRAIADLVAP